MYHKIQHNCNNIRQSGRNQIPTQFVLCRAANSLKLAAARRLAYAILIRDPGFWLITLTWVRQWSSCANTSQALATVYSQYHLPRSRRPSRRACPRARWRANSFSADSSVRTHPRELKRIKNGENRNQYVLRRARACVTAQPARTSSTGAHRRASRSRACAAKNGLLSQSGAARHEG